MGQVFSLQTRKEKEGAAPFENSVLDVIRGQISELERKVKRLYNLYAESEDELLLDTIRENQRTLEKLREQEKAEEKAGSLAANKKRISRILNNLKERWPDMNIHERQLVVRSLVRQVTITDRRVDIDLYV